MRSSIEMKQTGACSMASETGGKTCRRFQFFEQHTRGGRTAKGQRRAMLHSPAGAVDVVVVGAGVRLMYSMQNLNARLRG